MNGLRRLTATGVIAVAIAGCPSQASAQLVVFDPSNYAQNVLSAARALQQINNQITSLQNQAQMLINQTRNLTSLPYSSVQQIERSIKRTQELLVQAQRMAYDIQQIDRAFSTTYAPASSGVSDQALIASAGRMRLLACRTPCACTPPSSATLIPTARRCRRWFPSARVRPALCRQARQATSSSRYRPSSLPISPRRSRLKDAPRFLSLPKEPLRRIRAGSSCDDFWRRGQVTSPQPFRCSTNELFQYVQYCGALHDGLCWRGCARRLCDPAARR